MNEEGLDLLDQVGICKVWETDSYFSRVHLFWHLSACLVVTAREIELQIRTSSLT